MISELKPEAIKGKRVLLRCDLNVPLSKDDNGELFIADDGRIRASIPTIEFLLKEGAAIVICSHLGRPKGERNSELSLHPVAQRLSEILKKEIKFADNATSEATRSLANDLRPGEIVLLENIRFEPAETSKDENERKELAAKLSKLADFYVGDGFGAVHRKHASVYELAKALPHATGKLVAAEVAVLQKLTVNPARPYTVVLGGAKVSDKIGVINNLLKKVDRIAIGGGMVFTFLKAKGYEVGKSLLEVESLETVNTILNQAKDLGVEILLPTDVVVAPNFADESPSIVSITNIPVDQIGLDIGPESSKNFAAAIESSATVFWNGPMGVFEFSNFAEGTRRIAEALTNVNGLSVVGGGDSAAAVRKLGFKDSDFGYISTGGGASLEYLEGKELPGLIALQ